MKTRVYFNPTTCRWIVEFASGERAFFWEWENAISYALTKPMINEFDARGIDLNAEQIVAMAFNNPTKVKR